MPDSIVQNPDVLIPVMSAAPPTSGCRRCNAWVSLRTASGFAWLGLQRTTTGETSSQRRGHAQLSPRKLAPPAAPAASSAVPYFPPLPSIQEARPHRSRGLAASDRSALLPDVEAAGGAGGGRTSAGSITALLSTPPFTHTSTHTSSGYFQKMVPGMSILLSC